MRAAVAADRTWITRPGGEHALVIVGSVGGEDGSRSASLGRLEIHGDHEAWTSSSGHLRRPPCRTEHVDRSSLSKMVLVMPSGSPRPIALPLPMNGKRTEH